MARSPGIAAIKTGGLAIGMAACLLILEYVGQERRYDTFHARADRIVRVTGQEVALTSGPVGPLLASDVAGVDNHARILPTLGDVLVRRTDDVDIRSYERRFYFADSSTFDVFTFPVVAGSTTNPLRRVDTIVLSESAARKYFGSEDPVGRQLTLDVGFTIDFTITAVMRDVPRTSHFRPDFLASLASFRNLGFIDFDGWDGRYFHTYLLLEQGVTPDVIGPATRSVLDKRSDASADGYRVQPITDIHLHSRLAAELEPPGDPVMLTVFTAVAFLILFIAIANFVTLSTSRFAERAREAGIRKTVGADRASLIRGFMIESMTTAMLAGAIAVLLISASAPLLSSMTGFHAIGGLSFQTFVSGILLALGTGAAAGLYPAVVFSAVSPVRALRGRLTQGASGIRLRRALVVGQFVIGMILIATSLVARRQMVHLQSRDPGFAAEQTIVVAARMYGHATTPLPFDAIMDGFREHAAVTSVAATDDVPGDPPRRSAFRPDGLQDEQDLYDIDWNVFSVDFDAVEALGLDVIAGRSFSRQSDSDRLGAVLINETALSELRLRYPGVWQDPIGKSLDRTLRSAGMWIPARSSRVIGVVKDFHFRSLHSPIEPLVIEINQPLRDHILVRTSGVSVSDVLSHLESVWSAHMPDRPFESAFLDDAFEASYEADRLTYRLIRLFSGLAVAIAVLGLTGLAAHRAESRRREMAIRKSLGADTLGIVMTFSKEFALLVAVASMLAVPPSVAVLRYWLGTFAYRIQIPWMVFVGAAVFMLVAALATVSYHAVMTARLDPADVLKGE